MLMIKTFNDLSECTLANYLNKLESVSNVIIFLDPIVSFFVIKTVINESFKFCGFDFSFIIAKIINMVVLLNFSFFEICQIFLRYALLFAIGGIDWIIYSLILSFVYSQFITLRCLWDNRINSLNKLPLIWTKELIRVLLLMIYILRLMAVIILVSISNLLLIRIWQLVVSSRTGLSLWWNRFSFPIISLRIPIAWPFRIRKVETGSCLLEVLSRLDVVVLLTLNAGSRHSTYLSHLLFILVENMHLIFIILFHKEHFLVLLIIRWWHCLMRTGLTILLD